MDTSDDPITAGIVTTLIMPGGAASLAGFAAAVGAGVGVYSTLQQGEDYAAQGKFEQEILNRNAVLKEREAAARRTRAIEEARRFQEQGREFQGSQKAILAKGGVLSTEGSPALLLKETAFNLEEDRKRILREGFLDESFALSEAQNLRLQGRAAKLKGKNYQRSSRYRAVGTLLTGFGTAMG